MVSQTLRLCMWAGSNQNAGLYGWVGTWGSTLSLRNCRLFLFPCTFAGSSTHSKQSDTSLAAGGAGSWVVLKRTKQLFNCRSGSKDHSQIIIYITWEGTGGREKLWGDLCEAAFSQGFIPQGAEVNKGLNFRRCDSSSGGRQTGWEAGTAVLPPATADTREDCCPCIQPAESFWVFASSLLKLLCFFFLGSK